MIQKTLGGDRLGAGKKMKVDLHSYERSTHDLGYIWRSTMAPGTLVPFMNIVGLPGDTFDIELNAAVKTIPTLAPLFGSMKLQLDIFSCPIRLYNGKLHNNKLGVGLAMNTIKLPLLEFSTRNINKELDFDLVPPDVQQINPSSIIAYLGCRGIGQKTEGPILSAQINGVPLLAYWDIYKNYYSNKQEEIGAMIHSTTEYIATEDWEEATFKSSLNSSGDEPIIYTRPPENIIMDEALWSSTAGEGVSIIVKGKGLTKDNIVISYYSDTQNQTMGKLLSVRLLEQDFGVYVHIDNDKKNAIITIPNSSGQTYVEGFGINKTMGSDLMIQDGVGITTFPLENIDLMRETILSQTQDNSPIIIDENTNAPYGNIFTMWGEGKETNTRSTLEFSQEGLGLKTYQSDIFNNWLSTEWIDGENGINAITAIDTSEGSFTLDTLRLANKVNQMLNRIAVSGGTYEDWVEAVYDHSPFKRAETPIYCGGLSKEIIFQEVTNLAESEGNPLGNLGGKGGLSDKHKGGYITIKVDEPSIIMGIVSITPRIDYSQGNDWSIWLKTLDDLHKPALDEIGFQDLLTDQMAAWDTNNQGESRFYSAGKTPAWINYMTNFNKCYGEFAVQNSQMAMTLNRRYEMDKTTGRIKDLTTYIDPMKFNYAFAATDLTAQNFWVQIANDITARRKMSAKIMPNL